MNKYDDDFKLKIVEYSCLHGIEASAREFGVAGVTVYKWRNNLGETRYPEHVEHFKAKKLTKILQRQIAQEYFGGTTQAQLAMRYQTTVNRVKQAVTKYAKLPKAKPKAPENDVPEVRTIEYDEPEAKEESFVLTASELKKFTRMMEAIKDV